MKITWTLYRQFVKDYNNDLYPNERMGQAFMNKFKINDDQKLFYYQLKGAILKHIEDNYVDHESK